MKTTYIKQRIKQKRKELHQLENTLHHSTPCLTTLGVPVGHIFFYKQVFWIRTDRYAAYSPTYGSYSFNDLSDPEFQHIRTEAIKLDQTKVHQALLKLPIEDLT